MWVRRVGATVEARRRLAASTVTVDGPVATFPKPERATGAPFDLLFVAICRHVAWVLLRPWVGNGSCSPANARPDRAGAADASVAPKATARMAAAAQGRVRSMTIITTSDTRFKFRGPLFFNLTRASQNHQPLSPA